MRYPRRAAPPTEASGEPQKGARRRGAWVCFADESGFSLLPAVRGTWAPRGQTPVLRHRFSWTRMSMAGVLAYRPDRSRAKLVFQTKPGSYNTESLIAFLTELRRHLRGPVTLIWDGLSAHRSKDMQQWLATQQHWLVVEAAARLRPRPQPHRTALGQPQSHRTGQPLPRTHR
ncbi:transposase [Dactylosporangium darangshiense]